MSRDLEETRIREERSRIALGEAAPWRLASLLFERPSPAVRGEIAALAREAGDPTLAEAASAGTVGTEGLYLAIFGPGGAVSPREVSYRPLEDPGRVLSDLQAAYEAFAYRPATEEPIDHLAVETGFAGYLKLKESWALANGEAEAAAVTREAFRSFLRDRLTPFAAWVAEKLAGSATPFERAASALAARASLFGRPILGGVLIGGSSARMGSPKHLLRLEGRSYLERIAGALAPEVDEILLLGEGDVPPESAALRRLADAPGAGGPIAGILAALRSNDQAAWVIAPCDIPRLDARAVGWLLSERRPDRRAILPRNHAGRVEPLAAVYEPEAAALLERFLGEGRAAPSTLTRESGVWTPDIPPDLEGAFRDIDTPEDRASLR